MNKSPPGPSQGPERLPEGVTMGQFIEITPGQDMDAVRRVLDEHGIKHAVHSMYTLTEEEQEKANKIEPAHFFPVSGADLEKITVLAGLRGVTVDTLLQTIVWEHLRGEK